MTTPTVATITQLRKPRARPTFIASFREDLRALLSEGVVTWPSDKYQRDPCLFAEEILGMLLWHKQREILEAARDYVRVSVRSGHKIGKSCTAAVLALWFYCSFDDARVVFTSVTARQVDAILWRELAKIRSRAGCCLSCRTQCKADGRQEPRPCPHSAPITGTMNTLARSGFRADDFREVVGFTARDAEAVAGISGARILYLPDEASGIDDKIFEAIEGNRAANARMVMFSNPTRTDGEFYRSHTTKALKVGPNGEHIGGFYKAIHVSSEETPNVVERREVFPGLAGHEWVEEKRAEWGVDSPLYKVRVRGEFVEAEDGKILTVHMIAGAEAAWEDAPAEGRLFIGLDPAGPGEGGDESAFAPRRGKKVLELHVRRGLNDDGHLVELLGLLKVHRVPREPVPVVVVDSEGPIGFSLYARLRDHAERHQDDFVVVRVRSSDKASRRADLYDRVRDELWANAHDWVRSGGAIPEDARLAAELHAPSWRQEVNGKLKATPKSELRKMLDGRSPDRADAVCLSLWETSSIALPTKRTTEQAVAEREREADDDDVYGDVGGGIDPYGGGV